MSSFIWNLIEVNVVIILLFVGFMAIRKGLTFRQQRLLLLGVPLIAIITVTIKSFFDLSGYAYSIPFVELKPIVISNQESIVQNHIQAVSLEAMYGLGVLCVLMLLVIKLVKLGLFFIKNNSEHQNGYRIYRVNGKTSFSFFNRIQIAPDLLDNDQQIVMEHEKIHVDKKHSFDTITLELFHVIFWFNPIVLFIKRELVNIHEFEVDALMYKKHKVLYMNFLVNYAFGLNSSHYLLTSRFYNRLTLKKRIKIMKTRTNKRKWLLAIIPVIVLFTTFTQCTKSELESNTSNEPVFRTNEEIQRTEEVFDEVDHVPEFRGGQIAMNNYIVKNINYPEAAIESGAEGTVYVGFIVSKTGEVKTCEIKKGVDENLDKEALRVVSEMPDWIPGHKDGKNVAVKYTLPIQFRLSE